MEAAERVLQAARTRRVQHARFDAIMDERRCSKCKFLYGYAPYRPSSIQERPRVRNGEIKWCPKCEKPYVVLLRPMLWRRTLLAPYRYVDLAAALDMANAMGIGLPVKEEPDTRSVEERLQAIGMEVGK